MYMAKANGKSGFAVFDLDRTSRCGSVTSGASRLSARIQLDQFRLVYQPIVDLAEAVAGVEAAPVAPPDACRDPTRPAGPP